MGTARADGHFNPCSVICSLCFEVVMNGLYAELEISLCFLLLCIELFFLCFITVIHAICYQHEECIKDCDKAVERGRELHSDFKMIARALTRKGTALVKLAKCSKDYDLAIETFQKALTEHRNPDTLKRLNDAERAKKELEQQEYFDPKIADEEREKGMLINLWFSYMFFFLVCPLFRFVLFLLLNLKNATFLVV